MLGMNLQGHDACFINSLGKLLKEDLGSDDEITDEFIHSNPHDSQHMLNDENWKHLEAEVLSSIQDFEGEISIPSTLQDLLPKLDVTEKSPPLTVQARLEYLENLESGSNKSQQNRSHQFTCSSSLDQNAFINFVEMLNNQLAKYWKDDERVSVVKLVIQVAKMLGDPDTENAAFYPSLFFLLSDLITYFGHLVYDRLVTKSPHLKVNFTFSDVSDQAKEICKNWLYKIASIRELVPRFYLETALLKCYKFSCEHEGFSSLVERLSWMVKGIADPVVAAYARMYLVHTVQQLIPSTNPCLVKSAGKENFDEMITLCNKYFQTNLYADGKPSRSNIGQCGVDIFSSPLKWMLQAQFMGLDN